jgi:hypothetical protein
MDAGNARIVIGASGSSRIGTRLALLAACAAWDVDEVQRCLYAGAHPNTWVHGVTPLVACFTEITDVLPVEGPQSCIEVALSRSHGGTGLDERCTQEQLATVRLLLQHGADPFQLCVPGVNPLLAAAACSTQLLQVLLEAAAEDDDSMQISQPRDPEPGSHFGHATIETPSDVTSNSDSEDMGTLTLSCLGMSLAKLVCIRGCPEALQLLLDRGLVPDLQDILYWAIQVSCCVRTDHKRGVQQLLTAVYCASRLLLQQDRYIFSFPA